MNQRFALLLIALLIIPITGASAKAFEKQAAFCECTKRNDIKSEIEASDAIFVGEAVEIQNSQPDAVITFKVEGRWKGSKNRKISISTNNQGKACGYRFKKGVHYLVYAYKRDGTLHTDICSRTATIEAATADIKELNNFQ